MAKFLMLGKYSAEAIKGITAERTKKVTETIEKAGGKVNSMYALLGKYDLAFVVDFPGMAEVLKASVALTKLTGIGFTTSAAMSVEEFDKIIG
ncbi:MAG: GYD domain-containing protein [Candidatus Omnitrophica bacterium]|nr:GYD domain-containing protein [Candidatus Omnitrophota bacterium]MDD5238497.1 GYD domain-containing protein [Candidatus Omnitrophota bacterium]